MQEETEVSQDFSKERKRSRKKQRYNNIREQMEFYFSAANLSKERWISQRLSDSGSIELTHFLNFNKIRALTSDINDIVKALRSSEILEVDEECKVKRITPVQMKENEDECVIYVESIPPDAHHDWLKNFFVGYGTVDYVSLPKYSNSKKCKGFAFIEFDTPETANKAIEDYKKAGRYLSNLRTPQELLSISTFDNKRGQISNLNMDESEQDMPNNKKRKQPEIEGSPETIDSKNHKKMKIESEEECNDNLDSHIVQVVNPSEEELNADECSEGADESKKKKNRKKKKKTKKNKITPLTTGFQILSKKDWKCLRNKYLNIQKDKMKQLKQFMRQKQFKKGYNKMSEKKEIHAQSNNGTEGSKITDSKDFTPGLIVKIEGSEPIIDLKQFKIDVKSKNDDVKYVDVKEGSFCAFIRLATSEAAKDFCEKSNWNNADILKGEEELEYWERIEKERQLKVNKTNNKNKVRGKDKILKKAEKLLGTHITFDDD